MRICRTLAILQVVSYCLLAVSGETHAASMVSATYSQDGSTIARNTYSGPDGGASTDPAKYWRLLGKSPMFAYDVAIKPNQRLGKTATVKGPIRISLTIRNQINMGIIDLDGLNFVRDDAKSERWYLPRGELDRVEAIVTKHLKNTATVIYSEGYRTIATMIYFIPSGDNKSKLDRTKSYWALLGEPPDFVYRADIKPNGLSGKTMTVRGEVRLMLTTRPPMDIERLIVTDSLTLIRDDEKSDRWYLPKAEQKRIVAIVSKGVATPN